VQQLLAQQGLRLELRWQAVGRLGQGPLAPAQLMLLQVRVLQMPRTQPLRQHQAHPQQTQPQARQVLQQGRAPLQGAKPQEHTLLARVRAASASTGTVATVAAASADGLAVPRLALRVL